MDEFTFYDCYKCGKKYDVDGILIEINSGENFGKYKCFQCSKPKEKTWYEYFKSFIF
jgi:DNA-directed RNA polymerase subunit RPC12/RpoP